MGPERSAATTSGRRWALGAAAFAALVLLVLGSSGVLDKVAFAVAWGMWVAVPLGLELASLGASSRRRLLAVWPLCALLGVLSFLGEIDAAWVGVLASLYLGFCLAVALVGALELRRRFRQPASVCSNLGLLLLPVAGAWHLAERMGWTVLGFSGLWAGLTAAHFHFAGFATPILLSRGLFRAGGSSVRQWAEVALLALGVPSVALGITFSPVLALFGTACMVLPIWSYAFGALRAKAGTGLVRLLRSLSALVPLLTMSLALAWSLSVVLRVSWLDLNQMIRYHGLANALGFISLGFAAECLEPSRTDASNT
ncbi:MAG: YndJ family protein [Polyangiaceae bacterium]|nr:YndJ family protein [Polyangiaceae bacterium]